MEYAIDPFFVLVSVIAGIAIWRTISTLANTVVLVENLAQSAWLVAIVINLAFFWWRVSQSDAAAMSFPGDAMFLLGFLSLVLCAATLIAIAEKTDQDWFAQRHRLFFLSYLVFWVVIDAAQILFGNEFSPAIVPWAICIVGALSSNRIVQLALPFLMASTLIAFCIMFL